MSRGKVDDDMRRRAHDLRKTEGLSQQVIADRLGVSQPVISEILRAPRPGVRKAPKRTRSVATVVPRPELPPDASVAAQMHWHQIGETQTRIDSLPDGSDHSTEYAALRRVHIAQMKELERLLPKPARDPSTDPESLAARATVAAHVESIVDAVEARHGRLCPRCRSTR